jgi:hypothetical protein
MRLPSAVAWTVALVTGCVTAPVDPPFSDKGRGVWVEMPGAPPMTYRAVWGAGARDVYAAGDGGIAHFDGEAWRPIDGVPVTTYRAAWGRSSSEVWIGGDGALLARSLTGWQAQLLFDGARPITEYSVLALGGDERREYAIVLTGGKRLLLVNEGSAWETPRWRDASGPNRPVPQQPSLLARGWDLLVAGDSGLVEYDRSSDLGVEMWEGHEYGYWQEGDWRQLLPLASISGGPGFWVAAGGTNIAVMRDLDSEPRVALDAARPRDARGLFASRANRVFLVGEPVRLPVAELRSGVSVSPVEACDEDGCTLERVDAAGGEAPLHAIWGDTDGTVIAVGVGLIVQRESCGSRRCRGP